MAADAFQPEDGKPSGVRLAELVAALSLAADLGLGQPMEHVLRSCLISLRLGERVGLAEADRAATYYLSLLAWVGCTADSHETASWFGDDIALRADSYDVDLAGLPALGYMLSHAGAGSSTLRRMRLRAALITTAGRTIEAALLAHCQVTGRLAERLGLGPQVGEPLRQIFARWDGKGLPAGLSGEQITMPARLIHLADVVEVYHRWAGPEAAIGVARKRRGTQFDPALVDEFGRCAPEILAGLEGDSSWDEVISAEPALGHELSEAELDRALEAIGDFTDLKSPLFAGHSRGVAELAAAAASRAGHSDSEVALVRRAGWVHSLGRTGVPNTIWDKPGPLTGAEWERVRLHAYYTDRMLQRPATLARVGTIAALTFERMDGSGYHRGLTGPAIDPLGRILAAADAYHAMIEPRPYRAAHHREEAANCLRAQAKAGRLDASAVDAVLSSTGHPVKQRKQNPAGLTARETEILILLARGSTAREIATTLGIAPKTVGNHIEHIYLKIGTSTRAAAALFAMQHGLLDVLKPR